MKSDDELADRTEGSPGLNPTVLLINHHSPGTGGADVYVQYLAAGLAGIGFSPVLTWPRGRPLLPHFANAERKGVRICYRDSLQPKDPRIRLACSLWKPEGRRFMNELLEEVAPAVVHVNQAFEGDGIDLVRAAIEYGISTVVGTIHLRADPPGASRTLAFGKRILLAPFFRRFRYRKVFPSQRQRDSFAKAYGDDGMLAVVPNGILLSPVPGRREIEERKASMALTGKTVIAYAGRISEGKGVEMLVRSFVLARKENPTLFLLLIGDGSMRSMVEARLREETEAGTWRCTGWEAAAADHLVAADLLALPSRFESMPLSLIEALCMGIPCISTPYDGIEDLLAMGAIIQVAGGMDAIEFSRGILEMTFTMDRHRRMVRESVHALRKTFDCRRMAAETARLYASGMEAT
jgi:glycosyltransferase involved in cell wall biosynthesis